MAQLPAGKVDAHWNPGQTVSSTEKGLASRGDFPATLKSDPETLDIDFSEGTADSLTDGLLVMRYLLGLRGEALILGATSPGATRSGAAIETYLSGLTSGGAPVLDIDGNGVAEALTDGMLIYRYLSGERGATLIQGAVGAGATRADSTAIETYLATLTASAAVPPQGCTIVASPGSSAALPLQAGTSVQLTASCTSGPKPITYSWDSGAFIGAVRTVAPVATTTYAMTASNAAGSTNLTYTVYSAPTSYCAGSDQLVDLPWPASGQVRPSTNGFTNQVYSFRVTIPYTFSPSLDITHLGFIRFAEKPGTNPTSRGITLSTSACDFHTAKGGYLFDNFGVEDAAPSIAFTVNNPGGYQGLGAGANFQSGDVIYINIRNYNYNNGSLTLTCAPGNNCDVLLDFATPNRY